MTRTRIETSVAIVGAGPAGSALAIHLARQGKRVALIDRAEFPREKPCGEGLMPGGAAELARLGVAVRAQPFQGVRYRMKGMCMPGRFPDGAHGLGTRRRDLDAALCAAARAEPLVQWITGAVRGPVCDEATGAVRGVTAGDLEVRAALTVAADGAASAMRRALGWSSAPRTPGPVRFGVRRHFRLAAERPVPDWVDVFLSRGLEAYVTPLAGGECGVAILCDRPGVPVARLFAEVEEEHPELRALLEGAEAVTAPLGASPLSVRVRRRFGDGVVLLGDAAGNCDPISGGGITQALIAARMLAATLESWSAVQPPSPTLLARFDHEREAMLADFRRLTALQLAFLRVPPLAAVSLLVLARIPWLFSHLVGVAAGTRGLLARRAVAA